MALHVVEVAFVVCAVLNIRYHRHALSRTTPEFRGFGLRAGPRLGRREEFTAEGWRYRNLALRWQGAALGCLVLWWILLPT